MDVALNTNFLPAIKPNFNSDTAIPGAAESEPAKNTKTKFVDTDVIMDIEELQRFLFMLIGSKIPEDEAEDDKGKNLNLLA